MYKSILLRQNLPATAASQVTSVRVGWQGLASVHGLPVYGLHDLLGWI